MVDGEKIPEIVEEHNAVAKVWNASKDTFEVFCASMSKNLRTGGIGTILVDVNLMVLVNTTHARLADAARRMMRIQAELDAAGIPWLYDGQHIDHSKQMTDEEILCIEKFPTIKVIYQYYADA